PPRPRRSAAREGPWTQHPVRALRHPMDISGSAVLIGTSDPPPQDSAAERPHPEPARPEAWTTGPRDGPPTRHAHSRRERRRPGTEVPGLLWCAIRDSNPEPAD